MNKINIDNWKEFKISYLFDVVLSKGDIQAKKAADGTIPLVSSGKFNNGICKYIAEGDGKAEIFNGNVITTDMFGKSFYQQTSFYAVSHGRVNILIPRFELNKNIAIFLVSIFDSTFLEKYSFSGMCNQTELNKEVIKLPATQTGEPDFQYMEDYIKNVEELQNRNLQIIKSLIPPPNKNVNTVSWGIFQLSKLFDVKKGTRLTKANMIDGNINFIGASAINNGVTAKISNNTHIHPANTITVSYNGSVGATFYQAEYFWASDDVNVLYPKFEMNQQIAFFIIPIIKQLGKQYAFIDKWKKEDMEKTFIPLPMTLSGEPDFQYMEQTITALIVQQQAKLQLTQTTFA